MDCWGPIYCLLVLWKINRERKAIWELSKWVAVAFTELVLWEIASRWLLAGARFCLTWSESACWGAWGYWAEATAHLPMVLGKCWHLGLWDGSKWWPSAYENKSCRGRSDWILSKMKGSFALVGFCQAQTWGDMQMLSVSHLSWEPVSVNIHVFDSKIRPKQQTAVQPPTSTVSLHMRLPSLWSLANSAVLTGLLHNHPLQQKLLLEGSPHPSTGGWAGMVGIQSTHCTLMFARHGGLQGKMPRCVSVTTHMIQCMHGWMLLRNRALLGFLSLSLRKLSS